MTAVSDSHTVIWVPRFWPAVGGTEFHSHRLAQQIAMEHRVTVLSHCTRTESSQMSLTQSAAIAEPTDEVNGNLRTITLSPASGSASLLAYLGEHYETNTISRRAYSLCFDKAFRKEAKALLADADRIHFIYNGLTEAAFLAFDLADELNIPIVFTPNVLDTPATGSAWDSASFRLLYERADELIALTTHEKKWLIAHGASADKVSVVPYGPILTSRLPTQDAGDMQSLLESRFILFLARLVPEKGYELLLDAFKALVEDDADTQLVLVGPAEDSVRDMIEAFNESEGDNRVHLLQNVSQALKSALLEEAALLCVPSKRESLGGVLKPWPRERP